MSEQSIETRYKAYLTRRSKYEAVRACQRRDMVGVVALREVMIGVGELRPYLDDTWAKKVLGDTKLFEPSGEGFYVLTDEAEEINLGKRPTWVGERPGQDWVRETFDDICARVHELEPADIKGALYCLSSKWDDTATRVIEGLDELRRKEVDKPLSKLWEFAWAESMRTTLQTAPTCQQVTMWLMNAAAEVDAYTRVRAYLREGERPADILGPEDGHGARGFPPIVYYPDRDPDGSPAGVLESLRHRLVRRGIMKDRS